MILLCCVICGVSTNFAGEPGGEATAPIGLVGGCIIGAGAMFCNGFDGVDDVGVDFGWAETGFDGVTGVDLHGAEASLDGVTDVNLEGVEDGVVAGGLGASNDVRSCDSGSFFTVTVEDASENI